MSLGIILFSAILIVLLLDFSNAAPGDTDPQPGTSGSSNSQKAQNEEEKIANVQRELTNILLTIEKNKKYLEETKEMYKNLPPTEGATKQEFLKDYKEEIRLRIILSEQIGIMRNRLNRKEPLNDEYIQKKNEINNNLINYKASIKRIKDKQGRNTILFGEKLLEKVNEYVIKENMASQLEYILDNEAAQQQRKAELEALNNVKEMLQDNVKVLKGMPAFYDDENESLKNSRTAIRNSFQEIKNNFDLIVDEISKRREQFKRSESERLMELKKLIDSIRSSEDQQRQEEISRGIVLSLVLKIDERFIDILQEAMRKDIIELEKQLTQSNYIDQNYVNLRDKTLKNRQQLIKTAKEAQQYRDQAINIQGGDDVAGPSGIN